MNNPRFYVFGVPDGFNLFQGNVDDTNYFQLFYDGSKENNKLTIHRKANGQISYSYLKYKMYSVEGRAGSFFGISVVFNGEYCSDTAKLYRLFDSVYKEIILKNKILLEEIKENANAQAKFLVQTFKQKENEVRDIESIILKNIENKFENDIIPTNSTFKDAKPNLIRKININKSNDDILEALRDYLWVSVSAEYPEDIIDEISKEGKKELNETSVKIKDAIIENYNKILAEDISVVISNVSSLESTINGIQKTIKSYLRNQPDLEDLEKKFGEIGSQLNNLKAAIEKKSAEKQDRAENNKENKSKNKNSNESENSIVPVNKLISNSESKSKNHVVSNEKKDSKKNELNGNSEDSAKSAKKIWFLKFVKQKSIRNYAVIFGIIIIAIILLLSRGKTTNDCPDCLQYYTNFDNYLLQENFDSAWGELKKAKNKKQDISSKQNDLIAKVDSTVENLIDEKTIKALDSAKNLLENSKKYGNINVEGKIANISATIGQLQSHNVPQDKNPGIDINEDSSPKVVSQVVKSKTSGNASTTHTGSSNNITIHIFTCDANYENLIAVNDSTLKVQVGDRLVIKAMKGNSEIKDKTDKWKLLQDGDGVVGVDGLRSPIKVDAKGIGSARLKYGDKSCLLYVGR